MLSEPEPRAVRSAAVAAPASQARSRPAAQELMPMERNGHPYWTAALANMAWLHLEGAPARVMCLGEDSATLAHEFRQWGCDTVDLHEYGSGNPGAHAGLDLAVGRVEDAIPGMHRAIERLVPGGLVMLLVPASRQGNHRRVLGGLGFRIECRYLVARSLDRPMHFVPDRTPALAVHLQVTQRMAGTRRLARESLLRLGWRPGGFGARLLVAVKAL